LAIEDQKVSPVFLYPNPVKNKLFIKKEIPIQELELYPVNSQLITRISQVYEDTMINMEHLISGVYFVKITTQNGAVSTHKIIKE
jgi:hypothetical protein